MKKNTGLSQSRRLRSNAQRRIMLKKNHQKVLQRRKLFIQQECEDSFSEAC